MWKMDTPLLRLARGDAWSLRDAYEGVAIFGGIGSGKTSGSGRALAHAYLRAGFGGLVLCAKEEERALWERYARETGRSSELIVFDGSGRWRFNFLDYELRRGGPGSGQTSNMVEVLLEAADIARRHNSQGGSAENPFWRDAAREIVGRAIDALVTAHNRVSLPEIQRLIDTAPQNMEQLEDEAWRAESFCYQTVKRAFERPQRPLPDYDREEIATYWGKRYPMKSPKSRADVVATLTSLTDEFARGFARELFSTTTTLVPEVTHQGAIILVDLPLREWGKVGRLAQQIIKYTWQQATLRRQVTARTRPVFLWADEAHLFVSEKDNDFQSTARSARACTVYLTQNLPGLYSQLGGTRPEHAADAMLGNFQTKIFHSNSDARTNQWAADLIGRDLQQRVTLNRGENRGSSVGGGRSGNWSSGSSGSGGSSSYGGGWSDQQNYSHGMSQGSGLSETMDYELQPGYFAREMRSGGDRHRYQVDGIMFRAGRKWRYSGTNWLPCAFSQR